MSEMHCHTCGGFISVPNGTSYRTLSDDMSVAVPHSALCTCTQAIVYGLPPGYVSWPGLSSVARRSAAARN
jgi:hypothetical protein